MDKKMIAWVAGCACAATNALGQTTDPVTFYGRAYATVESVEAKDGAVPVPRRTRVEDRNSIVGIRGTEDLGGGLKAIYQLETLFNIDVPTSSYANRNSAVGLQGPWGTVIAGRWDTPFKSANTAVDPFDNLSLSDITGAAMNQNNFARRDNNAVQYWSPNWNGLTFRGHYSANENKTPTVNPSQWAASVTYASGSLYAAYAYEKHNDQSGTTAAAGIDEEGNSIAAAYRFGSLRLSGHYGEYRKTGTAKQKSYMAGLEWKIGQHVLLASYQDSKDGGVTTAAQPKCNLAGVGYRYDFSRRTFFISEYVQVKNEVGSLCNFGTSPLAITAGQDPRGFTVGLRHTF